MASERRIDRNLGGLLVANFANHDFIGIVVLDGTKAAHLILDGILDGDDLILFVEGKSVSESAPSASARNFRSVSTPYGPIISWALCHMGVTASVADHAQSDEVLFPIIAEQAARVNMVHLKICHSATILTAPAIAI
jgi:hypothetical protein